MTTITIDKELLEQVVNKLLTCWPKSDPLVNELRAALAAPATAPEFPADWAQMIHYPECWDTAAYPELRDAIHEALAWSGCSVCKPSTAPAWHDAQQAEIESLRWTVKDALESLDNGMTADCRATLSSATKETP
jgi:hypothetical protein